MTRIYLSRHGQTEWNVEKRMQGQLDSNLTPIGKEQAKALGSRLKNLDLDIIYSSSSFRALQTAKLVRNDRNLEIIPEINLREIYLGKWEGMLFDEVEKKHKKEFDNFWNHPEQYNSIGGESFEELKLRVSSKLEQIVREHKEGSVLIVTHGIVLKTLYTFFRNQPLKEIAHSPRLQSTGLCYVEKQNGIWNILNWNDTSHLL